MPWHRAQDAATFRECRRRSLLLRDAHSGTSGLPLLRTALPRLLAGAEIDITSVKDVSMQSAIVRSTLQAGTGSAAELEESWRTTLRIE